MLCPIIPTAPDNYAIFLSPLPKGTRHWTKWAGWYINFIVNFKAFILHLLGWTHKDIVLVSDYCRLCHTTLVPHLSENLTNWTWKNSFQPPAATHCQNTCTCTSLSIITCTIEMFIIPIKMHPLLLWVLFRPLAGGDLFRFVQVHLKTNFFKQMFFFRQLSHNIPRLWKQLVYDVIFGCYSNGTCGFCK